MAKCERRTIQPEPPPVEYVLTLSADEAAVLMALLVKVTTPASQGGNIYDALYAAGVKEDRYAVFDSVKVHRV